MSIPAGISVTKEPPSGTDKPYVTVTPTQSVYAKKSTAESTVPAAKGAANEHKSSSEDSSEEEEEEEDTVDVVAEAENFKGLSDAQINQLSKKGIAKW